MWRSYNEDWERRKSYLVRSLFHDVTFLSPVPEEANQSDDPPWSPRLHRAPSPLPQLIIEKEPNRHDEPEEYYKVLEIKIRRIYRKLFIEGRDLSDSDYWVDEYDIAIRESSQHDADANNTCSIENSNPIDEDVTENHVNYNTDNHYQDNNDFTEVTYCLSDSELNVDKSKEDVDQDIEMNSVNDECSAASTSGYIADSESTENHENSTLNKIEARLDPVNIPGVNEEEVRQQNIVNEENKPDYLLNVNGSIDRNVIQSDNRNTNATQADVVVDNGTDIASRLDSEDQSDFRQITTEAQVHVGASEDVAERMSVVYEESAKSFILVSKQYHSKARNELAMREECEITVDLEEPQDPVVAEESPEDVQDVVGEDSEQFEGVEVMRHMAKISTDSILLSRRNYSDNANEYPCLEIRNSVDSNSEFDDSEVKISESVNVIDIENPQSNDTDMVVYNQGTESDITSLVFDGEDAEGLDVNENEDEAVNSMTRKRKFVESTAVQTSAIEKRVNWEDFTGNFFVGAPKIFRLCSCNQHVCY